MKSIKKAAALAAVCGLPGNSAAFACTTTIVTKGASADGSVMVSHSDDGHLEADSSVVYVPRVAIDREGARVVYPSAIALGDMPDYNAFLIPRIQKNDGPEAYRHPDMPRTTPLGSVPYSEIFEVLGEKDRNTTYSYLDGNYGISNEWGVMFGECTNGAKESINPVPGKRIFYSSELSHVALENCKTARDAVKLIGFLIDKYGYWGTGETLPVGDANEAWVIEMAPLPADYEGEVGGLWIARLVPDGEFFIAGNEFRIRDVDPAKRNVSLMYGDYLFSTATELGWFTKSTENPSLMDWLPTVSRGEYSHPYYSLRRVWRGLSLMAPSLNLSPWVKDGSGGLTRAYPFSVKPDKPITLADIIAMHRDHYEGTEFDLTKGIGAGPWGNPNRYLGTNDPGGDVGDPSAELIGAWERPIGVYYTNITYVSQAHSYPSYPINVVTWVALNASAESVFVPLAVAPIPSIYESFDSRVFNMEGHAWQIYNLVGEYTNIKYNYMMRDVRAAQSANEKAGRDLVFHLQSELARIAPANPDKARASFSKSLNEHALTVHANWKKLFETLVIKHNQGYDPNSDLPDGDASAMEKTGYPDEWLKSTNYFRGPTVYKKKTES